MAAQPTPQPDSQPQDGAPPQSGGVSPAQQQANPLQQQLAAAAKAMETMSQQNPIVQAELMEARSALVKALQKTMMAARPQQQQPDASQGQ
jgi:hypothetical protein